MRRKWIVGILLFLATAHSAHATLMCHYTYGEDSVAVPVPATADPYDVKAMSIGRWFSFKVVYVTPPSLAAAINIYVYSTGGREPVLIEEQKFLPPFSDLKTGGRFGFTGLHFVYEPIKSNEFSYWCGFTARQ